MKPQVESVREVASSKGLGELSMEQLAFRARQGSMQAFAEIVSRMEARVYNFLLRRVRSRLDTEDLTQETFLRAWRNIARYREQNGFSTWLFTIAARVAIDHLRTQQSRRRTLDKAAENSEIYESDEPDRRDEGARLWELAAEVLSNEQHSALWLFYAEDLSIREIARVLGRTQVGVRVMLHRAKKLLLKRSSQIGFEAKSSPVKSHVVDELVEVEGVPCPCK